MKLILEHPITGIIKKAPIGFNWRVIFFGFGPALFRGDLKNMFIQAILISATSGFAGIVFAVIYNKIYIKKLLTQGFKVKFVEGGTIESARLKLGVNFKTIEE
jgi:hypothetical protein